MSIVLNGYRICKGGGLYAYSLYSWTGGLRELWWRSGLEAAPTMEPLAVISGAASPELNSVGDAASREKERQKNGPECETTYFLFSSPPEKKKVKGAKVEESRRGRRKM